MHLTNLLPILCFTSSAVSIAVSASNDGAGIASEQQKAAKREDHQGNTGSTSVITSITDGLFGGSDPVVVDPENFSEKISERANHGSDSVYTVRKNRKSRRSYLVESAAEPLPDILSVPEELAIRWMDELGGILSDTAALNKRSKNDNSLVNDLKSRGTELIPTSKNVKRNHDPEMESVWFSVGGGGRSTNDVRLGYDPYKPTYKRDETGLGLRVPYLDMSEKRSKALSEILTALNDQADPKRVNPEDRAVLDRRALVGVSAPVDAKPVQNEVINRIFKFASAKNKKQKRDIGPRQSPEEAAQQILQNLFRFDDDEEWKWEAPRSAISKRWLDWPDVTDKLREPDFPAPHHDEIKKRDPQSGGVTTHVVDGPVRTDAQDPNNYAWPDISLKVREILPKEADEISQRIIVTIFRMQENFRHKRSVDVVEVEREVEEVVVERREPSGPPGWSDDFTSRVQWIRLYFRRLWEEKKKGTPIHPRAPHSSSVEPSNTFRGRGNWPPTCLRRMRSCLRPWDGGVFRRIPWRQERLRRSADVLRRIVDSIDRNAEDEAQVTKRDVASSLLGWLENINNYFEETRDGEQPAVADISARDRDEVPSYDKAEVLLSHGIDARDLNFDISQLEKTDIEEWILKLRLEGFPDAYYIGKRPIDGFLSVLPSKVERDLASSGISGGLNSMKLAIRNNITVPIFITAFLEKLKSWIQNYGTIETTKDAPRKVKRDYDVGTYPWWSGSSEGGGEDVTTNPWQRGVNCARLRGTNQCGGGSTYKRGVGPSLAGEETSGVVNRKAVVEKDVSS
ncbi:hypothetical protein TWF730_008380 [Orbilia blumenaviensis]|uniref:Uncharacterized protein n=1 Tax=Orbilia blumenaviensis TaxID=1796055 RepID=A0AAV9V573_9PEZI